MRHLTPIQVRGLQERVIVISCRHAHVVLVLNGQLILLLSDGHHEEVLGHANLRLGLYRRSYHVAHVRCLIVVRLMLFPNDGFVCEPRGSLRSHSHAASLAAQVVGRDRAHLLSFDGVAVCDDALLHLILSVLDRVRGELGG